MSQSKTLRRHLCLLDVGHGNCSVLIAGESDVVVIDAGRQSSLSEFLREQQITRIRSIYLSHADADHIGGLVGLLATRKVAIERVFVNTDTLKGSIIWSDLLYELDAARQAQRLDPRFELVAGHIETLSGEVALEVLGPSQYLADKGPGSTHRSGGKIDSNSVSAIISISVGASRIALLPADVDGTGLDDLLHTNQDLSAHLLVYPHHGGKPGSGASLQEFGEKLLSAVKPNLVIFSFGREQYSNPSPDTVRLLRKLLPNARIACTQLSRHCARELPATPKFHLSTAFARGKERNECCAGTIVVPLDDPFDPLPQKESHLDFIKSHAPTALCLCPISEDLKL